MMKPEKETKNTKICPVCGTRVSENATRCLVCGTQLTTTASQKSTSSLSAAKGAPEIRLKLPVAIALGLVFVALLGGLVFVLLQTPTETLGAAATAENTPTPTATITLTPTMTLTPTPLPTWTPLPPIEYVVKNTDYCSSIAALFGVSVQSIIRENNLDANCTIKEGDVLKIPQPTPTPSPQPTSTAAATAESDCQTITITVEAGWTLSSIAMNYNVTMAAIREYNRMSSDVVREGMSLVIPLCERKPTAGPTPTATPAPPYPAPNLLLPRSGAAFNAATNAITLQWASVADLRENELYRVTVEDLTAGNGIVVVEYVQDTKYILPSTYRPLDATPHIFQWSVTVARQINSGSSNPIYELAGYESEKRVFSWMGTGTAVTPTP